MPLDLNPKSNQPDDEKNSLAIILEPLKRAALSIHFPDTDKHGNPNLSRFFLENGRLPFVGDKIKPWQYRGWLVPYLQMSEAHPNVSPRYDYVLRTLDAGKLLDEPLPQIHFFSEFSPTAKPGLSMLNKCLDKVEYSSGSWNGIREFCEWLGFALGVTTEPSKLSEDVQEFLYRTFNLENLLLYPSDYFGQILCETNHGKKNGFYPTPINVCQMMAEMLGGDIFGDRRHETFVDPAGCGTGRMLLVASNYSMRLFGMDIDYLCVLITKINLALYAPWFYVPDDFFPQTEEKTAQRVENKQEMILLPQTPAAAPNQTTTPESLFDMTEFEQGNKHKNKKSSKKKFTTEIEEQPSLFDIK